MAKIFPPSTGGARKMAEEMGVKFLGDIELDPRLGQSCDSGKSYIYEYPDSRVSQAYRTVITSKIGIVIYYTLKMFQF